MRKILLLLGTQFIVVSILSSQYSPIDTTTFIFKLKTAEVRELFNNPEKLNETYFHSLVDSSSTRKFPVISQPYPHGHYLLANASGEVVNVLLESVNTISAVVLPNRRDLLLQVYDSLGQEIRNALVTVANKEVPFNSKKGGYFKAKWKEEGVVEINIAGESLFYQLQKKNRNWKLLKQRYQYFSKRKIGRVITSPIRLFKGVFNLMRGSVRHQRSVPYFFRNIKYKWGNKWRRKFQYKGYTALQQPMYQPKDTVKVKAYITNRRGKPLKKELYLQLVSSKSRDQNYFDIPIEPDGNGNYTYEFPLGDSLRLDQTLTLIFYDKDKRYNNKFTQQFRYEDYQLDQANWSFNPSKDFYHYGEPVIFYAEGKDANGNTVPDGNIKLTVLAGQVYKHYKNPSYIPDTIWQKELPLRTRGETQIIVPDKLIPIANMELIVKAEFVNSNGEIHEARKKIKISRSRERIRAVIRNGYIYADYYRDGKLVDTIGTLEHQFSNNIYLFTRDSIQFPFKQRINPYVSSYYFNLNNVYDKVQLIESNIGNNNSKVNIYGEWNNGVAEFKLTNPHQIPIHYTILTKDRVVLQDSSVISETIFSKSNYHGAYYINYTYIWGGQAYDKSSEIRPYKKQLNILIKQDSKVCPGDLVNTEIEVRNYKGNVEEGVNLTAGAYNSQFKKKNNFTAPKISYKVKRSPFEFINFSLTEPAIGTRLLPMSRFFYDALKLKDHFFHQVRYGNTDGILLRYDSLDAPQYANFAQVAPYIIKDGKEIPAELIYINSKLVYYAGTTVKSPYSFLGFEGANTITVRTKNTEYVLKDIELKKGHKLEMFVDLNTVWKSEFKNRIVATGVQDFFSHQEKTILNLSIFQYKDIYNTKKYIWQDNEPVFIIPPSYRNKNFICTVGPLKPSQNTGFVVQDRFVRNFVNTPMFKFEIYPDQERLYSNPLLNLKNKFHLNARYTYRSIGELVHTTNDIITQSPKPRSIYFGNSDFRSKSESGRYQFQLPMDTSLIAIAITNSKDSLLRLLRPDIRNLKRIEAGSYNLYLFTKLGYYSKHKFTIKTSNLLYEYLSELNYQRDSLGIVFNSYANTVSSVQKRVLDPYTAQFIKKKQQGIVGKISVPRPDSTKNVFQLDLFKDDLLVTKTLTDSSGYYQLSCYPGAYEISILNLTDNSAFKFPVFVKDSSVIRLDLIYFQTAFYLHEIQVIGYREPLINQDNTTQGFTVRSDEIRNLPTRSINGLAATSAGVGASDMSIRGSRFSGTVYYIDGVQVSGELIAESYASYTQVISGIVSDAEGEALIGCSVSLIVDGKIIAGTLTGIDGSYTLKVPGGSFALEFSYTGYQTQRIVDISSEAQVDVILEEGILLLEEVMVVAFSNGRSNVSTLDILAENASPELEGGIQLRSDFKDYAYWQPNLITDKDGRASFQSVFPDKLTSWRTFVIGMGKKSQAGVAYSNTKSFKPLVAQLALPRFLIAGDKPIIIGKSVNYSKDIYPVETKFLQEEVEIQANSLDIKEALIETVEISAPTDIDSLSITYELQTGEYGDGEQRQIPIFPSGIEETVGSFHVLEGDTTLLLNFDPQKGPVTMYAQSDLLNLMLEDLEYLNNYPYGCNEQTASRLMGLLLEKQVRALLNQPFENEDKIIKMIIRLKKNQNKDGSWGWWANNPYSQWITIHVLKSLAKASEEGYTTSAFDKGIRYVTNFLPTSAPRQQIQILELLSSINQPTTYETYLSDIDSLDLSIKEQYTVIKIKQEQNMAFELDSLESYRRTTIFGGDYWGVETHNIMSERVDQSLLAYQIYRSKGDEKRLQAIRQYFIMRRSELSQTYGRRLGRNTYETVKILAALLPDILAQNSGDELTANELTIVGSSSQMIKQFPFQQVINGETSLQLKKKGTGTLFLTAYQQFFNTNPAAKIDLFDVNTQLIQSGKNVKTLKQGEKAQLIVDLKVDKDTEYAMIEIPIPAACSYYSKPNTRNGTEVHREYFRNKTAIFCRNLPKGEHQYSIDLEVRFAGMYTLLPAKVEQMYFPVFYGRNEVKRVNVD